MSSTSSENNKTTYQHLPKQGHSPGKVIFDDENDELLDALKYLLKFSYNQRKYFQHKIITF